MVGAAVCAPQELPQSVGRIWAQGVRPSRDGVLRGLELKVYAIAGPETPADTTIEFDIVPIDPGTGRPNLETILATARFSSNEVRDHLGVRNAYWARAELDRPLPLVRGRHIVLVARKLATHGCYCWVLDYLGGYPDGSAYDLAGSGGITGDFGFRIYS